MSADDFEDAPCGYLITARDGTLRRVNRTFETLTGLSREELLQGRRFQQLLTPGGQIYHETHYAPLLQMQGFAREIALEIVCADGARLPVLVNSALSGEDEIRTLVFEARDRRRYEQELLEAQRRQSEIARELQRSMLAGSLASAPGLEIGVYYRPAVRGQEVGGDWYDAFELPNGRIALSVGDVVGRGLAAAATMGQLRSAIRALASTGAGPGPLLDALDDFSRRHGIGRMTTVVYGELDPRTNELRFACGGHPPPLLLEADGDSQVMWGGRSLPLDTLARADGPRAEASCTLEPGSTVLMYSDGLVERRTGSLDEGFERLRRAGASFAGLAPAEFVSAVTRALDEPDHADDVCLLAARLTPS